MCGRYVYMDPDYIQVRFATSNPLREMESNYNVAPGTYNPTVSRQSPNRVVMRKWGLVPGWVKDPRIGYKLINARLETVVNKPAFRTAFAKQRCLVPSNGFYEWKEEGGIKQAYFCGFRGKKMFGMAGLYEMWKDGEEKKLLTYTIITREAKGMMEEIHARVPVIVRQEDETSWLEDCTSRQKLEEIMVQSLIPDEIYPVSREVGDVKNNDVGLLERI